MVVLKVKGQPAEVCFILLLVVSQETLRGQASLRVALPTEPSQRPPLYKSCTYFEILVLNIFILLIYN